MDAAATGCCYFFSFRDEMHFLIDLKLVGLVWFGFGWVGLYISGLRFPLVR